MKGEPTTGQTLLTDDELRTYLRSVIHNGFVQRGNMSVPTTAQYNLLGTDDGLKAVFHDICRWLGTKPSGITIAYTTEQTALYKDNGISIPAACATHPLITGRLLVFAALTYYLERYGHKVPTQSLIEFASIETGLGIWVLNGLPPRAKKHRSLYHKIKGHHVDQLTQPLTHYTTVLYAHQLANYAHNNHILAEQYLAGVSQTHRYLLPTVVTSKSVRSLTEPIAISNHHAAARLLVVRCILLAGIAAAIITLGILLYTITRPAVSYEQKQSELTLKVMKTAVDACVDKAQLQQNTFDPNDFSLTQQTDATKVRCESLRNEYNYALKQHDSRY